MIAFSAGMLRAQTPEVRIRGPIDNAARVTISGTRPVAALAANDLGRLPGTTQFQSVSIAFSRSAAQQTALDALVVAQQDPTSPKYHQWLSPEEFGAQFGAADADIAQVEGWLQAQGFTVEGVSRDKTMITFSGTSAQVEAAFGTEIHYFTIRGEKHFAPASDLSIPAALAPAILSVGNVSDLKPRSHIKKPTAEAVGSKFTSSQSGGHDVQPGDVAVIYDINPAYSAGYTGAGQTIAVVGQSAVVTSDITNFQTASGVPVRAPNLLLVPSTGQSAISQGDEAESDLDLEYTSAIAKGASITFVYTGNTPNTGGAFYAMQYAIQNKLAPIISVSYGNCEVYLGSSSFASLNQSLQQAATQGQTVIAAAGDDGSTDCYEDVGYGLTSAQQGGLSVDFPASSQYVTGMGGTEYLAADVATTNTQYWISSTGTDVITSAKSYIPEQVWNDDGTGLSSGGGGVSIYAPRPSWQTGVPGIASGSFRLVPDIALASSPNNGGYLYCSSDPSTGITGSCSNGFRDANNVYLTIAGGTSFAAPIFAGMFAIINQKTGGSYQGVINPTLYTLAANSATYASAFHDIQTGSNACTNGVTYSIPYGNGTVTGPSCLSGGSYSAGVGYDQASGLGSVDLYNLMTAWPKVVPLTGSSTTVTAGTLTPSQGATDTITFTVASASGTVTTTPTGTIQLSIGGSYVTTLTLTNGKATYNFNTSTLGAQTVQAVYSGDTVFATSTGTITLTVITSNSTTSLTAATTPAVAGTADTLTVTVTPTISGGAVPTGSVSVTIDGGAGTSYPLTAGSTSAVATIPFNTSVLGSHTIVATYQGNTTYMQSGSTLTLTAKSPGTFTLAAPTATVVHGNTVTETVTVTSTGGYFGPTNLTLSPSTIVNACYSLTNPTVTAGGTTSVAVTIYTNSTNCSSQNLVKLGSGKVASNEAPARPNTPLPAGLAMAGLAIAGVLGRRSRRLRGLVVVGVLAVAGFALSGCGSSDTTGSGIPTTVATGSYTITVTGSDATTGTINATTTFTLTVQ